MYMCMLSHNVWMAGWGKLDLTFLQKLLYLSSMGDTKIIQTHLRIISTAFLSLVYFLINAGAVKPAERPLPPAKVAPLLLSSSLLNKQTNDIEDYVGDRWNSTYSMRSRALYLATRSLLAGAPVLIWPTPRATDRSAMMVFSVSPLRWEIITPQPSDCASWAL
jgi:hypothetical protein